MKKFLFGIGVVAVIFAAAAPSSFAQCPMAREFGAQGSGTVANRIKIDNTNCPHDGDEVGERPPSPTPFSGASLSELRASERPVISRLPSPTQAYSDR